MTGVGNWLRKKILAKLLDTAQKDIGPTILM